MYDNQYDISAHISEIVDYLIELINENSVCIIIDNVQNLDEVSIEMFERLIDKEDYKNNVTFVFSFNTDKLYSSTKPYQFHKKLNYYMHKSLNITIAVQLMVFLMMMLKSILLIV